MSTKVQQMERQEENVASWDEQLEYHITVFKPFLLKSLRACHLLVFLHHFKEVKAVAGKVQYLDNRRDLEGAADELLCAITRSPEPGKWQAFIDAVKQVKATIILDTLLEIIPEKPSGTRKGQTDHEENAMLISVLSRDIQNSLDLDSLLPVMVERELICEEDKTKLRGILKTGTKVEANFVLLILMPRHNSKWFHIFLSILYDKDESHRKLANLIDPDYCAKHFQNSDMVNESTEELQVSEYPAVVLESDGQPASEREEQVVDNFPPPQFENVLVSRRNEASREATCDGSCCVRVQTEIHSLRSELAATNAEMKSEFARMKSEFAEMKRMLHTVLARNIPVNVSNA